MKRSFEINSTKIFILFFFVVLIGLAVFQKSSNALPFFYKDYPTYQNSGKKDFDSVSESLVLNRIDFSTLSMDYKYKFNLWRASQEVRGLADFKDGKTYNKEYQTTSDYLSDGQPYRSQIGAQSLFFAKLSGLSSGDHGDYFLIKLFSVLFLSLCAAVILLWVNINFGHIPSFVSLLFFIMSTGINIFSESLYWSIWLFILPLAIVCLLEVCKVRNIFYIFLLTLPVFLFKFLSGYEFITIIVFAAMTPYAWDYFINKDMTSFVRAVSVGISSLTAFLISLFIYNKFFLQDFNSSGIDNIFGRSGSWSLRHLDELGISPWTQSAKILIMNFMDFNGYGIPLGVFLISTLVALVAMKDRIQNADIKFIVFLFAGSISWLIVQPGHILFHPRYATLMFFIPFGLFIPGFIASLIITRKKMEKI